VRIRLLGRLRRDGPLSASKQAAGSASSGARRGTSASSSAGLVEEAGGGRGRRRLAGLLLVLAERIHHARLADASRLLERFVLERYVERLSSGSRDERPSRVAGGGRAGDSLLYLTAGELAELRDALAELAERYLERTARPELRPRGARAVALLQIAFPDDEP
jgi:hypothetical protein